MPAVGFRTLALTHMEISPPKPLPRGHETILLVEPEPETRKLAAFMLTKQGYQIIEARNAAEASRIFEENAAPIDMLLTEARMIRVSGHELSQTLTRSSPGLRTLFLADRDYERTSRKVAALRGSEFVVRPFTMAILAAKVRQMLDAPARARTASVRP